VRKAFKYRLYPTSKQEQKLFWTLTHCRELYNAALQERKEAYKYAGKSITYKMQASVLPEIKGIREEYQDIHSQVLQNVLKRLEGAFERFFERVKNGETPGYPRFKGRNRYNSFTYPQAGYSLTHDNRVCLSKIGSIKVKLHRPLIGKIKTCTVKYEAGQWYVIFSCEVEQPEPLPESESEVGIDLGVTHFAALSDGTFIESPRFIRRAKASLKRKQQVLSERKRGSHRRERARKAVAKAHRKIRNQRADFHHKQSTNLVKEHQTIVFEELEMTHLTKRAKPKQDENGKYLPNGASAKSGLTKSILDAGWGQFQQMCVAKAEWAGRTVLKVSPKYTSQVCSQCGTVRKKELSQRRHSCECGCELDRDTNAAINILRLGRSPRKPLRVRSASGTASKPVPF
jgi:putative transposase